MFESYYYYYYEYDSNNEVFVVVCLFFLCSFSVFCFFFLPVHGNIKRKKVHSHLFLCHLPSCFLPPSFLVRGVYLERSSVDV